MIAFSVRCHVVSPQMLPVLFAGFDADSEGQAQAGTEPAERSEEISFGRRGAEGRERVTRDAPGEDEGSGGRSSPLARLGSSTGRTEGPGATTSSVLGKRPGNFVDRSVDLQHLCFR